MEDPDGVCDPERKETDPDCGGGVPASACSRTAGMAAAVRTGGRRGGGSARSTEAAS